MSEVRLPAWLTPPSDGFTADDLDRLPDLPPHTELIDGSLVFVSPQSTFHMRVLYVLEKALRDAAPPELRVRREMTVRLDERQRPEPDIIMVRRHPEEDDELTYFQPGDVQLAIEVVSPESEVRDRERKPELYARAGIAHFWRVERTAGGPVVYVYELDPATRQYVATGIHHGGFKAEVPFPVDIDLGEIKRI